MSLDKARREIEFELKEITTLFQTYKKDLFEINRKPNLVELAAFASVLHSFYSGIEKIFSVIAKRVDKKILTI